MGKIDDAVPFFGENFNKIYPLIMVVYTILIATNFFDRVMSYFGNWNIFRLKNESEADDLDGFDPSGLMILQKGKITILPKIPLLIFIFLHKYFRKSLVERSSLEKGHKVGELVIPLARHFNGTNTNTDVESGNGNDTTVNDLYTPDQ